MFDEAFLQLLDSSLAEIISAQEIKLHGTWSKTLRRTYESTDQLGTGSGPFVDVDDVHWHGTLNCSNDVGVLGLLVTPTQLYWAKAPAIAATLPIRLSLQQVNGVAGTATFAASFADAALPGVPVRSTSDLVIKVGRNHLWRLREDLAGGCRRVFGSS